MISLLASRIFFRIGSEVNLIAPCGKTSQLQRISDDLYAEQVQTVSR